MSKRVIASYDISKNDDYKEIVKAIDTGVKMERYS